MGETDGKNSTGSSMLVGEEKEAELATWCHKRYVRGGQRGEMEAVSSRYSYFLFPL